ncbi:MAG: DUF2808 domain-containing protein [Leptolyngbyaceae cyanobacterium bins.349]|nr:DUF2808 domain-containing protein [Leptolyngbyaceae cyanobacterium bins.349]
MPRISVVLILSVIAILSSSWAVAEKKDDPIGRSPSPASVTPTRDRATSRAYRFSMVLPTRAGEQFSMVSLSLQSAKSGAMPIPFDVKTARAAIETANGQPHAIAIRQTWIDETGTLWLEFKPALAPQTRLTVSLNAHQQAANTIYEYGIAAYADSDYPAAILVDSGMVTVR